MGTPIKKYLEMHMTTHKNLEIPDAVWKKIESVLPKKRDAYRAGRPRKNDRVVLAGVIYRCQTNISWHHLPEEFGSKSTIHRRYTELVDEGILNKILKQAEGLYSQAGVARPKKKLTKT
jgi:transposase